MLGQGMVKRRSLRPYSVASCKKLWEYTREQLDFPRSSNKFVIDVAARVDLILDAFKEERMLTYFSQLHEFITQALDTS